MRLSIGNKESIWYNKTRFGKTIFVNKKTMSDDKLFAKQLKELRAKKSVTMREVAVATNLDTTLISKLERGTRLPTSVQISQLAHYFEIPEDELQAQVIADTIIRKYGINQVVLNAAHILLDLDRK